MSNPTAPTVVNCQARAYEFLVGLMGARPDVLTWDSTHRLQGHAHHRGHDLVVIATRDPAQPPVVLTEPGWDAVRRSPDDRHDLIQSYSITDHSGLVAAMQ